MKFREAVLFAHKNYKGSKQDVNGVEPIIKEAEDEGQKRAHDTMTKDAAAAVYLYTDSAPFFTASTSFFDTLNAEVPQREPRGHEALSPFSQAPAPRARRTASAA